MSPKPRTQRVPVAMAEPTRPAEWLRNFRLSGFALTVLLLLVAALVVLAPRFKTLVEQQQQIAELQAAVEEARNTLEELDAEVDRWRDPSYIEAQARDRLYYVYPGDIAYLVIDDGTHVENDDLPISDTIQTARVDWMSALLASIYTAGSTDATPEQLDSPRLDSPQQKETAG